MKIEGTPFTSMGAFPGVSSMVSWRLLKAKLCDFLQLLSSFCHLGERGEKFRENKQDPEKLKTGIPLQGRPVAWENIGLRRTV